MMVNRNISTMANVNATKRSTWIGPAVLELAVCVLSRPIPCLHADGWNVLTAMTDIVYDGEQEHIYNG